MRLKLNLRLFDDVTNVTTQSSLSVEMKTYYDKELIRLAGPHLVHDQFAQQRDIPKNEGKTIQFRKYAPLPKALTPLTEGVTPDGQALSASQITATVAQYGGFIRLSDMLILTAIDNNLLEALEEIGDQAGRTLDTITREVLMGGTNVQYGEGTKSARSALDATDKLTVVAIKKAVRTLKRKNAPKIGDAYVGIIHPDVTFDLTEDTRWIEAHKYCRPDELYTGEIGKIAGVRFVETSEAKIFAGAGASSRDVYATMILGKNAYGTTKVTGGGLQTIVKQLGSGGTADPLNQRATVGWKAVKTAARLVEEYMVRIETCSDVNEGVAN